MNLEEEYAQGKFGGSSFVPNSFRSQIMCINLENMENWLVKEWETREPLDVSDGIHLRLHRAGKGRRSS